MASNPTRYTAVGRDRPHVPPTANIREIRLHDEYDENITFCDTESEQCWLGVLTGNENKPAKYRVEDIKELKEQLTYSKEFRNRCWKIEPTGTNPLEQWVDLLHFRTIRFQVEPREDHFVNITAEDIASILHRCITEIPELHAATQQVYKPVLGGQVIWTRHSNGFKTDGPLTMGWRLDAVPVFEIQPQDRLPFQRPGVLYTFSTDEEENRLIQQQRRNDFCAQRERGTGITGGAAQRPRSRRDGMYFEGPVRITSTAGNVDQQGQPQGGAFHGARHDTWRWMGHAQQSERSRASHSQFQPQHPSSQHQAREPPRDFVSHSGNPHLPAPQYRDQAPTRRTLPHSASLSASHSRPKPNYEQYPPWTTTTTCRSLPATTTATSTTTTATTTAIPRKPLPQSSPISPLPQREQHTTMHQPQHPFHHDKYMQLDLPLQHQPNPSTQSTLQIIQSKLSSPRWPFLDDDTADPYITPDPDERPPTPLSQYGEMQDLDDNSNQDLSPHSYPEAAKSTITSQSKEGIRLGHITAQRQVVTRKTPSLRAPQSVGLHWAGSGAPPARGPMALENSGYTSGRDRHTSRGRRHHSGGHDHGQGHRRGSSSRALGLLPDEQEDDR